MLTDSHIKKLKARKSAYRVFDRSSDPGFHVKVYPSGKKAFYMLYRFDGKDKFFRLGTYHENTGALGDARQDCRTARKLVDDGIDPQANKASAAAERKRTAAKARSLATVETLFDKYIERLQSEGKRSAKQVKRIWAADISPVIGGMKAKDVTPTDIKSVLHPIIERDAMVLANRCRSYLMAAFRFGIEWEHDARNFDTSTVFGIQTNPARDVPKPQKSEAAGQRTLTEQEIQQFWGLWQDPKFISKPAGAALRLILATGGQRVEEVLKAAWREFDDDEALWELPATRTKSGRPHVVPTRTLAQETLDDLATLSGAGELLFPLRGKAELPMQTNSLGNAVRRFCVRAQCVPFTARDLRRTVKTIMGKMGISKDIRDRLQNHALTDVSSKHYDRYDYLREKRAVMDAWDAHLREVVAGNLAGSNVLKMEKKAK